MFCNWECPVIIFKEKRGKECVSFYVLGYTICARSINSWLLIHTQKLLLRSIHTHVAC